MPRGKTTRSPLDRRVDRLALRVNVPLRHQELPGAGEVGERLWVYLGCPSSQARVPQFVEHERGDFRALMVPACRFLRLDGAIRPDFRPRRDT